MSVCIDASVLRPDSLSLNSQLPQHENEWTASFYSVWATSKTTEKWRVATVPREGLVVRQNAGVARGTAVSFRWWIILFFFLFFWMSTLHRALETSHHFVILCLVKHSNTNTLSRWSVQTVYFWITWGLQSHSWTAKSLLSPVIIIDYFIWTLNTLWWKKFTKSLGHLGNSFGQLMSLQSFLLKWERTEILRY